MLETPQIQNKTFFLLLATIVILVNARPSHLGDNNQVMFDQEDIHQPDVGLRPWQVELLAQKLEMMNQIGNDDYAFERSLRSGTEKKRRYRTCFFNPVSCFKK